MAKNIVKKKPTSKVQAKAQPKKASAALKTMKSSKKTEVKSGKLIKTINIKKVIKPTPTAKVPLKKGAPAKTNKGGSAKIKTKPTVNLSKRVNVATPVAKQATSKSKEPAKAVSKSPAIDKNKTASEKIASAPKKNEPKGRFEIEYVVHASPNILFEFLSTPSGLSEWFADDVDTRQGIFVFYWEGMEQEAKMVSYKEHKHIRFQWMDKNDGSYFEFKIEIDDLTNDLSLIVTDFAEGAEQTTSKLLWDSQINKLLHVIGAYI